MNLPKSFKLIVALLCASMFTSCYESSSRKTSDAEVWVNTLEPDGQSGATALGEVSDLNWNTPITQLKNYLDSNNFNVDTARLDELALYAYPDLRQTPFYLGRKGLVNQLNKQTHSMGESAVLIHGFGYYFSHLHSSGTHSGIDLGLEYWKIDTSNWENVEQLQLIWKEKYHPMPFYSEINGDNLYVFYTRSIQFDHYLRSCVAVVKKEF